MVSREKKQKRIYQFEISRLGLAVISIASLGVMLWMFIFGIWVGRDAFSISKMQFGSGITGTESPKAERPAAMPESTGKQLPAVPLVAPQDQNAAGSTTEKAENAAGRGLEEIKPVHKTLYTLQVASLRDLDKAAELKSFWEKKGYEVFIVTAEVSQKGTWYRVQIGRYASSDEANATANKIAETEKTRLFITTVSVPAGT